MELLDLFEVGAIGVLTCYRSLLRAMDVVCLRLLHPFLQLVLFNYFRDILSIGFEEAGDGWYLQLPSLWASFYSWIDTHLVHVL